MSDGTFFNQNDVKIDKNLARFGTTSYPIANIGSVSVKKLGAGGQAPIGGLIALFGIYLALLQHKTALGVGMIVVGVVMYYLAKPKYAILLRTSSGDQQAFESKNESLVSEIKNALETAIVTRG
ncbi:DUF6232 family protein [Pararhizobium qamdonense]|uniref:DUF6232 family protein n=1 Tax=Pararhizobium qamdonense TaxID=3031126 RepID=UPI0023E306D9|nr:DUF6232 family protein [Pararhizobium qamdonense]